MCLSLHLSLLLVTMWSSTNTTSRELQAVLHVRFPRLYVCLTKVSSETHDVNFIWFCYSFALTLSLSLLLTTWCSTSHASLELPLYSTWFSITMMNIYNNNNDEHHKRNMSSNIFILFENNNGDQCFYLTSLDAASAAFLSHWKITGQIKATPMTKR